MRSALGVVLVILGLPALAGPWLPAGVALVLVGGWLIEKAPTGDGEGFITVLMLLGGLGTLCVILLGHTGWITAQPVP